MSQANILAQLGSKAGPTFRNRLIDAGFIINQRIYVSNTALASGVYAHDRWKAGASGCTYTFTQGSLGVPIAITITAGSLQQVIEGCNMPEGGTYVLSWTGTAQARFNGGTYGSSPLAVTGITAGANTTIEFNTGTLSFPQLEVGSSATGFEYRQYGQELALCQRYYQQMVGADQIRLSAGNSYSSTVLNFTNKLVCTMRATPTFFAPNLGRILNESVAWYSVTGISQYYATQDTVNYQCSLASSGFGTNQIAYHGTDNQTSNPVKITFSAEL